MDGEGTVEQSSTPEGVAPSGARGNSARAGQTATSTATADVANANVPTGRSTGAADIGFTNELSDADFKQDGDLRAPIAREISKGASTRGAERSFNEVTGKTTVTTTVGGQTVTFEEDGDTRGPNKREAATDSAIRAFDSAVEADSEGV